MTSPFLLRVHGRSGHGAMPGIADNALVKAARLVERVAAYREPPRLMPETERLVEPVAGSDGQQHRFASSDPSVVKVVAALRDVYERKPVTLIRAMYERPAPPTPTRAAQAFADAFRVRPPEER